MSDNTDKFNPFDNTSGGGTNAVPERNFLKGSFNFIGGNGKVLSSQELNDQRRAYLAQSSELGTQNIQARYTGDGQFAPAQTLGNFTYHVTDANGNGAYQSAAGTVNQVIAGPGIYISAPNGQGVVTISTSPIDLSPISEDLIDVAWTKDSVVTPAGTSIPHEFIAVGRGGVTARSRDGVNWVKLAYPTVNVPEYYGVEVIRSSDLTNGIEYAACYANPSTHHIHLSLGYPGNGDGFEDDHEMVDQNNNPITGELSPYGFPTLSGTQWVWLGNTGKICSGQAVILPSSNAQVYQEHSGSGQLMYQAAANNSETSDNISIIVTCHNYDPGTGAYTSGGGVFYSTRTHGTTSTWTQVYTDASIGYWGCSYGNNEWVVGGDNNTVLWSTNGTSWTKVQGAQPGATWWSGAYGNGTHVMVGYYNYNGREIGAVQYSKDGGKTWSKGNAGTSKRLFGVTYSPELNMFVAVGAGGSIVSVNG